MTLTKVVIGLAFFTALALAFILFYIAFRVCDWVLERCKGWLPRPTVAEQALAGATVAADRRGRLVAEARKLIEVYQNN